MTNNFLLQRKYVRDSELVPATNFYVAFRDWMNINFPAIDSVVWSELLEEDEDIDYSTIGNGRMQEETVINDGETDFPPETFTE